MNDYMLLRVDHGQVFRYVRNREGLNITQFAALLGITRSMLGKIERGTRRPSGQVYLMLSEYTGKSIPELVKEGATEIARQFMKQKEKGE